MEKEKAYGICLYKKEFTKTKVLLCKSALSTKKWGFLKGVAENFETKEQTAIREFFEESSIEIEEKHLENYFEQTNQTKDIGIFLVNFDRINHIRQFFCKDQLFDKYLSAENTEVRFFDINNLPPIKKKQHDLTKEIVEFFR